MPPAAAGLQKPAPAPGKPTRFHGTPFHRHGSTLHAFFSPLGAEVELRSLGKINVKIDDKIANTEQLDIYGFNLIRFMSRKFNFPLEPDSPTPAALHAKLNQALDLLEAYPGVPVAVQLVVAIPIKLDQGKPLQP